MIATDRRLTPADLLPKIERMWEISARKIRTLDREWDPDRGAPVFTVEGRYTTRGWTEWTEGFLYGSPILQFDATGETDFLDRGREMTRLRMPAHVTHFGVHDHGFNNVSTYGNLLRLAAEGRIDASEPERDLWRLALRCSGAVQAHRWTALPDGAGYIASFNGPHSLFVDTIRSCRVLALAHALGHELRGEGDRRVSLLERLVVHARTTARYNIYYGRGRDAWDTRGRVAHESIFNLNDGRYRCPSSQQGYSALTTWTRGLAWAMTGFAEELEYLATRTDAELDPLGGREAIEDMMREAARATCDFYIAGSPADGIPYWDTGAPGLARMDDPLGRPSDPYNDHEPVDSSAAAIAVQGLVRLGNYLEARGEADTGDRYRRAGLVALDALLDEPYLSTAEDHHGLILHSIYHRPNGWDHVPAGRRVPCGESSMWGDYHAREAALLVGRMARGERYPTFFAGAKAE